MEVYPGKGQYDHYLDNGEDFAYREGEYHQYRFNVDEAGKVWGQVIHSGYGKPYKKILTSTFGEIAEVDL